MLGERPASVSRLTATPALTTEGPDRPSPEGGFGHSLRSAMVYSAALAVQRAIGFVLLPLYTRALAPAEYGALGVLLSIATLAVFVFSVGLDTAIFRNYFRLAADPDRQQRYVDS